MGFKTFSRIKETLYKSFLQMKVEEEGSNLLLVLIALRNSHYSIFREFLKMVENTLALMESLYQMILSSTSVPDYSDPVRYPNTIKA